MEINSHISGSTGKIMLSIAEEARKKGYDVYTISARHRKEKQVLSKKHIYIGSVLDKKIHNILSEYTGTNSCFSNFATIVLTKKLKKINPDFIHFHNLHSNYLNLNILFRYINKYSIPVIWTLHDCWAFTGHCVYFDLHDCQKWKCGCEKCEYYMEYPKTKVNNTALMYEIKKRNFISQNIKMIVTPSEWLANLTKESFLGRHNIVVVNNGIDTNIFSPKSKNEKDGLRNKYGLTNKIVILAVAMPWTERKGPDYICQVAELLGEDYAIVVIGPNGREINWNNKIIRIDRTENQEELAEFYSMADMLINPTLEDNFPTVNLEALSSGTPVITFDTGGSPEPIVEGCGAIVKKGNILDVLTEIQKFGKKTEIVENRCREKGKEYSIENQLKEYMKCYESILKKDNNLNFQI